MWTSKIPLCGPKPIEGTGAALYLGNSLVATNMDEQITYALHSRPLVEYILLHFEWTDTQWQAVNWTAIGLAKRRLKWHMSYIMSKMMFGWLNFSVQKSKSQRRTLAPAGSAVMQRMRTSMTTYIDAHTQRWGRHLRKISLICKLHSTKKIFLSVFTSPL